MNINTSSTDLRRCGLYSFPKSGNTWLREIVRAAYAAPEDVKFVAPDIYQDGADGLAMTSRDGSRWRFYKSHAAREVCDYRGSVLVNDLIIYVKRNPLDVFCSQLNYLLRGFDKQRRGGIQIPCESIDEAFSSGLIGEFLAAFSVFGTLMPFFADAGSWFQNVAYWTERASKDERIIVVKYEDLVDDIGNTLRPILVRLGMETVDINRVAQLADSRTRDGGQFYWSRTHGTYRRYLTRDQIDRFIGIHGTTLSSVGYADYYTQET